MVSFIRSLFGPKPEGLAVVLYENKRPLSESVVGRVLLSRIPTFGIEKETTSLSGYVSKVAFWDMVGRWDSLVQGRVGKVQALNLGLLTTLTYLRPKVGIMVTPIALLWSYFCIPRKSISVLRMEYYGKESMVLEDESSDFMCVTERPQPKTEGAPVITGTYQGGVVASIRRRKRTPYAARVAQAARAKVGILKNTPENRMIYQKVILGLMEKDRLRYVDRDMLLPLAIGYCFVYTSEAREAAALWESQDSLGVK
nr:MAG: hypothetical protein 1 [Tombusviridae sp.]